MVLFERNRRGTVLTEAGAAFLQDVRRVFAILNKTRRNVQAVAAGLSEAFASPCPTAQSIRLSASWPLPREEPEIEIRLSKCRWPISYVVCGLDSRSGLRTRRKSATTSLPSQPRRSAGGSRAARHRCFHLGCSAASARSTPHLVAIGPRSMEHHH